ncbi:MAG: hypothetical protein ACLRMN_02560 [Mediterraneibacter gnavus]
MSEEKTIYGEFVDDIGGYYTVAFVYLALGVCAYNCGGMLVDSGNKWMLVSGGIASICDILARLINKDYVNFSKIELIMYQMIIGQKRKSP